MPNKIVSLKVDEISSVDKAANGKKFLLVKRDDTNINKRTLDDVLENWNALDDFYTLVDAFYVSVDDTLWDSNLSETEKSAQISESAQTLSNKLVGIAPNLAKRFDFEKRALARLKKGGEQEMELVELLKKVEDEDLRAKIEKAFGEKENKIETEPVIEKEDLPEDIQKAFDSLSKRVEVAENVAKKEREKRLETEFTKRAEIYKSVGEVDKIKAVLKEASDVSEDFVKSVTSVLDTAKERLESNNQMLKNLGANPEGDFSESNTVEDEIQKKAEEIAKRDNINATDAYVKALNENPDLYTAYKQEQN